jgi:6-phosphogluconolactonase (cycloisomerase 2 family)
MRGYFDEEGNDRIFRLGINPETGSLHSLKSFSSGGVRPRMFEFTSDLKFILVCNKTDNEVVSLAYDEASGTIGNDVCGRVCIRDAAVVRAVDFPM